MEFPDRFDHPLLRELYLYWEGKRAVRRIPRRCDIDPVEIPSLLPYILLTDVLDAGERFRFRLAGTEIVEAFGFNPTGRCIDEIMVGEYCKFITDLYKAVVTTCRPVFASSEYSLEKGAHARTKRLLLPLSENDAEVTKVITLQVFFWRTPTKATVELDKLEGRAQHLSEVLGK